ncbi:MAG: hypothetical protein N2Z20_00160 [Elusimicrobiales bacterium]|nr:hypothetical protein [Elusimicrobiales bacterium]
MLVLSLPDNEFYIGNKFSYDISLNLFLTDRILFDVLIKIKTPKSIYFDTLMQIFNKVNENSLSNVLSKGNEKEFMLMMKKSNMTDNHIDLNMLEYTGWYEVNYSKIKANAPFSKGKYIKQVEMENTFISNQLQYLFLYYDTPQNNIFNTNNVHILLVNRRITEEFKNNYINYYQNKSIYTLHTKIIVKDIEDIPVINIMKIHNYIFDFELFGYIHTIMRNEIYNIFNKRYILFYKQDNNFFTKII